MGYEYITQPQIFLAPITAVNGIQGVNEAYPLLTTYQSWTSTAAIPASAFPIPGSWTMLNESGSFLITVGGVLQPPSEYTIDRDFRILTFNSLVSAGVEIAVQQLATAAPSAQNLNYIQAVSGAFITLSANNIISSNVNLTAINAIIQNLTAANSTFLNTVFLTTAFSTELFQTSSLFLSSDFGNALTVVGGISSNGSVVFDTNSVLPALRITQTGSGNALEVEDSTHPDSTLFRITSSGRIVVGISSAGETAAQSGTLSIIDAPEVGGRHINLFQTGNDIIGANTWFFKTRGTTVDSQVALGSADNIIVIAGNASDGEAYRRVGDIILRTDGLVTLSSVPTRLVFTTTPSGSFIANTRMVITNTGSVGIGTSNPNSSAILELSSTASGFLPPRLTTAQRASISTPAAGLIIYNTDTNYINYYTGTAWFAVTGVGPA